MLKIETDNRDVEKTLLAIHQKVIAHGGWLHPGVKIIAADGNLSVCSTLAPDVKEDLIRIPAVCLPAVEDFDVRVEGGDLVIKSHSPAVSAIQVALFEAIIALYNHTGKIPWHRATSLWFCLADAPELLDHLMEGRKQNPKVENFYKLWQAGQEEKLMLDSFFSSRTLRFESSESDDPKAVMMPIIDLMNHHFASPGFKKKVQEEGGVADMCVLHSKPVSGSDECFVCYNTCDPLDSLLNYSFVDTSVTFVRSIPLEIRMAGVGTLVVHSRVTNSFKGKLAEAQEDLRYYLPMISKRLNGLIEVTHLYIPGAGAPRALRRALSFLINGICPGLRQQEIEARMLDAEQQVLQENRLYYQKLARMTVEAGNRLSPPTAENLQNLAAVQLEKIKAYGQRLAMDFS